MIKLAHESGTVTLNGEHEDNEILIVRGTPEQRVKNQAALDWLKKQQAASAKLSAADAAELDRQWEAFKQLVNGSHTGGGKPFRE